jgi:O-acetyl-ADP-ribose deacetylase (regulator of RNase III)
MHVSIVHGELLAQDVDALVCPRSRPPGVRGRYSVAAALRRRAGRAPFEDAARRGALVPGSVVMTAAGHLPHRAILHAVTVGWFAWACEDAIRKAVRNVLVLARRHGVRSIAMPLLGAGGGRRSRDFVLATLRDELSHADFHGEVRIVVRPGHRWRCLSRQLRAAAKETLTGLAALNALGAQVMTVVRPLDVNVEVVDPAGRPIAGAHVEGPGHENSGPQP